MLLWHSCSNPEGKSSTDNSDQFSLNIRTTDPLSPEDERHAFHLPPGFEVQLFASEPDIAKPLNMSFDNRGRMWLTQSYEYPFPDTTGAGKDKISILEDTDGDGSADKITVFADSLNIPIGIQVVPDGAIAYSIPGIWHFIDKDGDDQVDERKMLYSGFRFGDTHGMVNNFVRSWDGWIHADHGFSNTSTVAGSDGDTIVLTSGNTFRFRMDGSHLEFTTTGRVNPYGYAYDELGYTYSVDCHTSPVYQLVRGADYPHFGKKPTGIGFGPALMKHDYGSTALAGLEYYIADQFPEEFRYNFYYGDVVRSRVSRNHFEMNGTTPVITQEEDFIISDDPWFRPVDVKLGPDGALYIADFYNRIIGHYEVPLDHPGRDRQRGRIWRIVYNGTGVHQNAEKKDFSSLSLDQLIENLNNPNLPLRMAFADQIVDRFGESAIPDMQKLALDEKSKSHAEIQALWILYRLNGLNENILQTTINHPNDTIKVHALRIFYELNNLLPESLLPIVQGYLNHPNPHVQRQAVMVISRHPNIDQVRLLLDLLKNSDTTDTHFYYSIRQSLRDQIRNVEVLNWVLENSWQESDSKLLADVMVGVDHGKAAQFLTRHLGRNIEKLEQRNLYSNHAARWLPTNQMDELVKILQPLGLENPDEDYSTFLSLLQGMQQGGKKPGQAEKQWASMLAEKFLASPVQDYAGWKSTPIDRQAYIANNWQIAEDTSSIDHKLITFISSGLIGGSSSSVASLQSEAFKMPEQITFYLKGQKNTPDDDQPASPPTNRVELISQQNGERLYYANITRQRTDTLITWNAGDHLNENVYFNLIDGSNGRGEYIAIGGITPRVVDFPATSPEQLSERQVFAAKMVRDYKINALIAPLKSIMDSEIPDIYARNAAVQTLLEIEPAKTLDKVASMLDQNPSLKFKELLVVSLSESNNRQAWEKIMEFLPEIPYQSQKEVVMNLGSEGKGIEFLLSVAENNRINPRLVLEPQVQERLEANINSSQERKLQKLRSEFTLPVGEIDNIINDRLRGYVASEYSPEKGQAFFSVFCSTCHEVNGNGGNIGPQLNGVGNWGSRALCEKILDPNRNISKAFVTYTIKTKDGNTQSGLLRREEGQSIVFANQQGQEFSIDKNEIVEQKKSPYTLMPDYFRETIPAEDFKHLITYLLSLKGN